MTPTDLATSRADRLLTELAQRDLDALLVTDLVDLRWLTGFTGSNGLAVVTREHRVFVSDFRYVEQAAEEVTEFEFRKGSRDLLDAVAEIVGTESLRLGFDDAHLSVKAHRDLAERLPPAIELAPAGGTIATLRRVKDEGEIEKIRAAAALADDALEAVLAQGLAGRAETEAALALEFEMRRRGASNASFPSIVAAGPHGALPHAQPREEPIPADVLVVIDWGAQLDGYCSDCTRTVATGERVAASAREGYDLVLRAQLAAGEAIAAGQAAAEVDGVARSLIADGGLGEEFGHGLGHGVGLEVHEGPRLGPSSQDVLAAGEVVTNEPGVYVPGSYGVRIEDLVVVREDHGESLSRLPKSFTVVG
jgi:Xaa-Pro aminopeptidase